METCKHESQAFDERPASGPELANEQSPVLIVANDRTRRRMRTRRHTHTQALLPRLRHPRRACLSVRPISGPPATRRYRRYQGGVDESGARMSTAPASGSQGALGAYPNGMTSQPTLSRGMSVPRMDGLGYAGQQGGQHVDEPPKRGGLLSILCCR